jgi:hypothetical protein
MPCRFKVGDKVRCIFITGSTYNLKMHGIYVVSGYGPDQPSGRSITLQGGSGLIYPEEAFELDKKHTQNIRVGDIVRCIDSSGSQLELGKAYKVSSIAEYNITVEGLEAWYHFDRFELDTACNEKQQSRGPFKAGDYVKCLTDDPGGVLIKGKIYKVLHATPNLALEGLNFGTLCDYKVFDKVEHSPQDKVPADPKVEHPTHYNTSKFEVWDVLDEWFPTNPLLWQVGKYIARAGHKDNTLQDLKKAASYLQREIDKHEC